jgi:predicted RNase H-like HicB family nuclease
MGTATAQRLTAILHREEKVYVAECPEVGTVSQGDTVEEALANLREASELFLEECPQPAMVPRLLTTFEKRLQALAVGRGLAAIALQHPRRLNGSLLANKELQGQRSGRLLVGRDVHIQFQETV